MKKLIQLLFLLFITGGLYQCSRSQGTTQSGDSEQGLSQDSLLTLVQYQTFQYFWDGAEPVSGLARERYHADDIYPAHDKGIRIRGSDICSFHSVPSFRQVWFCRVDVFSYRDVGK